MDFTTWDIETTDWVNIRNIAYYNEMENGIVYSVDEILDIMERIGGIFFAHYSGGFDNRFLLKNIMKRYDKKDISIKLIHNKPSFISIKNKFQLRDSFLLLPASLKKLAIAFNTERKHDIDRTKIESYSKKQIDDYVLSDCRILYNVLKKAENSNFNYDLKKLTFPSIAFNNWKKHYIKKDEFKNLAINKKFDEYFRESYYGGRCEVFKRYGENLYYYDVNSMYPFNMKNQKYPYGRPIETKKFNQDKLGVYDVLIKIPKNENIPPIPIRRKKDNKIIFPNGIFRTKITNIEINEVIKIGGEILEIYSGYYFNKTIQPFKDYVDYYYDIKLKNKINKNSKYEIAKFYLNSLYGKLSQKREFKELQFFRPENINDIEKDYNLEWSEKDNFENDIILTKDDLQIWSFRVESKLFYTLVHIGLFVTAYSRIHLWKKIKEIENKGGTIYYCDTDSIITDIKIDTSLDLGDLDLEHKIKKGIFISPKLYCFYDENNIEVKSSKGVDKKLLHYSDFEKLLNGENIKITKDGTNGFLESLKNGNHKFIDRKILERIINSKYDKRELKNNIETLPFTYNYN